MSIYAKVNNTLVEIQEVITKMGGVLVTQSPLQAKINGILVDFISYGYGIAGIINMTPSTFDVTKLASTINGFGGAVSVVLNFGPGEFLFDKALKLTVGNVTIKGTPSTKLKCNGSYSNDGILHFEGASGSELTNITIQDLLIDGNNLIAGNTSHGIRCNYVGKVQMPASDTAYDATAVVYTSPGERGVTIKNCIINNTVNPGILGMYCSNSIIANNVSQNNSHYGIYLMSSKNNVIQENITKNNTNAGITVSWSKNILVNNNMASNNTSIGINFSNSSKCIIAGNVTQNNLNYGIFVSTDCVFNTITGNATISNGLAGIVVHQRSNNNTVSGNTVRGNPTYGIYVTASFRNLVNGNVTDLSLISDSSSLSNVFAANICGTLTVTDSTSNSLWFNRVG